MGNVSQVTSRNGSVFLDDQLARQAADAVDRLDDVPGARFAIELQDGRRVQLSADMSALFFRVLDDVASGRSVALKALPVELSTSVAASELGVSRPTLMKLIARDELAAHKKGSHTRIFRDDLMRYRKVREERIRQAIDESLSIEDE